MAWPIVFAPQAWHELSRFEDRESVLGELAAWTAHGPPCNNVRELQGATIYDDETESAKFQYVIGVKPRAVVAILRIRPREFPS